LVTGTPVFPQACKHRLVVSLGRHYIFSDYFLLFLAYCTITFLSMMLPVFQIDPLLFVHNRPPYLPFLRCFYPQANEGSSFDLRVHTSATSSSFLCVQLLPPASISDPFSTGIDAHQPSATVPRVSRNKRLIPPLKV